MLIENPKLQKNGKEIILSARIIFNNGNRQELFISAEKKYATFVKNDASAFLASLLLPAMKLGEDIQIDGFISAKLLSNAKKITSIVSEWNIGLKKIKITAKNIRKDEIRSKNIGTFFSGGVDSFATYLKNKNNSKNKINYFIFVHGFDIFLNDQLTYSKISKTIKIIAKHEGVRLIFVKTNLREITDQILGWGYSFGGALGGVALFIRNGFTTVYIPSSVSSNQIYPWGSHPHTDPLWSTESLRIIHDSNEGRLEKIKKYISKSPIALKYLRVCWLNYKYNCGQCSKCVRTMLELLATDSLDKSGSFPKSIDIEKVLKINLSSYPERVFYEEIFKELKIKKGNIDVKSAIEYILSKSPQSSIKQKIINHIGHIDRKFNKNRLYLYLGKKGVISRL